MTQGYGPEHGQQGQWGQGGQNPPPAAPQWGQSPQQAPAPQPQWGQSPQQAPAPQPQWGQSPQQAPAPQPQWQQASPAASPSPWQQASPAGAPSGPPGAPSASSKVAKLVQWMFYAVLAVIAVRLLGKIVVFGVSFAAGATGSTTMMGAGTLVGLLLLLANMAVTLALLILAVMVTIQASGRGRTGAIVVIATVVLSVVTYWILYFLSTAVMASADTATAYGTWALVYGVVEFLRALIVFAVLIVGALMSRRWASQSA